MSEQQLYKDAICGIIFKKHNYKLLSLPAMNYTTVTE